MPPTKPTLTLVTPEPITTATPEIEFAYDTGKIENVYPYWCFINFYKEDHSFGSYAGGGGWPFAIGQEGTLGESGTFKVPFALSGAATPGTYYCSFRQGQKDLIHPVKIIVAS
jgi:hypothetical protein